MLEDSIRRAIARFNEANGRDPTKVLAQGAKRPKELLFAERLEAWIYKLTPNPSPALRLAARCQHLKRFEVPRSSYPDGRVGYLKWRKDLAHFHAREAELIMEACGIEAELRERVRAIQLKQELKQNPDGQAMEDALCLSFLEHEFGPFLDKHEDGKLIDILQKSWRKMSERGHGLALTLRFEGRALELVRRATSEASPPAVSGAAPRDNEDQQAVARESATPAGSPAQQATSPQKSTASSGVDSGRKGGAGSSSVE